MNVVLKITVFCTALSGAGMGCVWPLINFFFLADTLYDRPFCFSGLCSSFVLAKVCYFFCLPLLR